MPLAEKSHVRDRGLATHGLGLDVVELHTVPGATLLPIRELPLAAAAIALPDGAADPCGDVVGPGGRRGRAMQPRLPHQPLARGVLRQRRVRAKLEDVGDGGARPDVRERQLGSLDLGQELAGDGEVEPAELAGHRLRGLGTCCYSDLPRSIQCLGVVAVQRLNWRRRQRERQGWRGGGDRADRAHARHYLPNRHHLARGKLGREKLGVVTREMEEARQCLGPVLRREHPCQLGNAADAELALPEGLENLGEPPDEVDRLVPVEGVAARQAQLADQELEETWIPQPLPAPAQIEVRQFGDELRHRLTLSGEQAREVGDAFSDRGHRHDRQRLTLV